MSKAIRYGQDRVRAGLRHFVLGKGVSSVAGFVFLILLVRHLSVAEFATYSVLQAFIEVFTALTGLGLTHAALRYVPELYACHENRAFKGFVVWAFGLRLFLLTLATLAAWFFGETLASLFGLSAWLPVFKAYLLVVWLRVNTHFLFQLLESTLHQGLGQAAVSLISVAKLVGMGGLILGGEVDLLSIVWLEAIAESVGVLLLLGGLAHVLVDAKSGPEMRNFSAWWREHASRVMGYSLTGYLQHLAILPYGSAPNRLLAGRFLDVAGTAAFGSAQSFADLFRRYLPAQLLGGLIRPVLIARYATSGDFSQVGESLSLIFRVNAVLLGAVVVVLLTTGPELMSLVSKGKYGSDAALLLSALLGVLVLESRRFLLDIAIQAVEMNRLLIMGNLVLAGSLIVAVWLMPWIGAMALPIAAATGLVTSNAWISRNLSRHGFVVPLDLAMTLRIVVGVTSAIAVGMAVKQFSPWWIAMVPALGLYGTSLWWLGVIRQQDLLRLKSLKRPVKNA